MKAACGGGVGGTAYDEGRGREVDERGCNLHEKVETVRDEQIVSIRLVLLLSGRGGDVGGGSRHSYCTIFARIVRNGMSTHVTESIAN